MITRIKLETTNPEVRKSVQKEIYKFCFHNKMIVRWLEPTENECVAYVEIEGEENLIRRIMGFFDNLIKKHNGEG